MHTLADWRICRGKFVGTHPEYFAQTKTRRGNGGRRDDLDNRYFRSAWEANWARYLNWLQAHGEILGWEYEPDTFEFTKIKRGSRFYTPDFKVTLRSGEVEYHEIKGYMDQRSATKLARMARYFPKVRVVLVEKDRYYAVASTMQALIPTWERRR